MSSEMDSVEVLARVARGESEWQAVRSIGVAVESGPTGCSTTIPPSVAEYDPTAKELAIGFLAALPRGDVRKWADVILCGPFGFDRFSDTGDGERLKELLWDASFGSPLADDDRAFLTRLAQN
jgi:hypothetical protein